MRDVGHVLRTCVCCPQSRVRTGVQPRMRGEETRKCARALPGTWVESRVRSERKRKRGVAARAQCAFIDRQLRLRNRRAG